MNTKYLAIMTALAVLWPAALYAGGGHHGRGGHRTHVIFSFGFGHKVYPGIHFSFHDRLGHHYKTFRGHRGHHYVYRHFSPHFRHDRYRGHYRWKHHYGRHSYRPHFHGRHSGFRIRHR